MALSKSPLRYPGGKQKLAPFIAEILDENNLVNGHYVEPYAGGAGAALELLLSKKVNSIHLNDSSYAIYAFWHSILTDPERFCRSISSTSMNVDEWKIHKEILKHSSDHDIFDVGFSTFFLNRVNRSGVLTGGIIGGQAQSGTWKMDARFTRNDLIRRVETVAKNAHSISISNLDAEEYIMKNTKLLPDNTLIYFDPPYYEKASGLYLNFYRKDDHSRLAEVIQNEVRQKWVLSYDSADQILSLYENRRSFIYDLQYNASTVYKGKEVFVFCDTLNLPDKSSLSYIDIELAKMDSSIHIV
ncbi:DNA adenine methylase [Mucilaginibacter sp. 21P]|uniref:DNA adenine methylase n=1 Tax=Mucilaginibacter sp. 21P TaxID=2778902 RepID=UPI001C568777|nr:DNA adenine methylase [Mucilaginibacter sp. 21P]QXV66104.1 DNA adenine methylase [Mucilaginibacter sp. 21P]